MTTMYREDGSRLEILGTIGEVLTARDEYGDILEVFSDEKLFVTPDEGLRATLEDLENKISASEVRLRNLISATAEERAEHGLVLERIGKLAPSLKHIEDYLLGKFTHFAFVDHYNMQVKTMEEALKDPEYGRDGAFRLLTMSGKARQGQSPTWRVNQYHDGSGGWSGVVPCMSEEDALEVIKVAISRKLEEGLGGTVIENADKFGVEVPDELRRQDLDQRVLSAERKNNEDRKRLEESSAHLDKVREECRS